jgi:hypothetical protein
MTQVQTVTHRVAVSGWVTDAESGKAIAGAQVTITSMPPAFAQKLKLVALGYGKRWPTLTERADRTQTKEDGLFYFLDLPIGKYTFNVSATSSGRRYAVTEGNASVTRDAQGSLKMTIVKLALRPTAVKGKITGPNHKAGVVMAEVRIKGSGERTYSDAQGQFVLAAIEPGTRTVQVSAQGYKPSFHVVKLPQPGAIELVNVVLARDAGESERV